MNQPPYAIPHQRPLTPEEKQLIAYLLEREAPSRLGEIDALSVVARCGCGKCPTIMFIEDTSPLFTEMAHYLGQDGEGTPVGVVLLERHGRLAELEAWSPAGVDITALPELSTLKRFE
jgi:hypothetical protein